MFYYIAGKPAHIEPSFAVLDVGGVGYKMTISTTTYESIPRMGQEPVKLYTHLAVREDDIELFGFYTLAELSSFRMLITVSGVGPKAAMSILSTLTPEKFALAVCTDDKKSIAKASGIGPKTAARVILELKDKMMKESGGELPTGSAMIENVSGKRSKLTEAVDALIVLGFSRAEALATLKEIDAEHMELEEIIRISLKKLNRF